jgi:iron complex outermembrane receptor protein
MMKCKKELSLRRIYFLACTSLASGAGMSSAAYSQNAGAAPLPPQATGGPSDQNTAPAPGAVSEPGPTAAPVSAPSRVSQQPTTEGLQEIVVTAQKREQRLQDVPIAITAVTQATLQANRVTSVNDLSGLAPNVTVRASGGSTQIPSFTSRGVTSYGVVPGSDKEFSVYLDGVYLGASRSLFELPDIERIEVLRGPQGTLFGRNSTAGAVSVVTRDPAGTFGIHQDLTMGNYAEFRSRTSVDLPAVGPFSAYVSYVHDERRGDIRNTGAGTVWDRTGPDTKVGVQTSPKYLGDKNEDQVFAAVKFEPSDNFKTIYKFDYGVNHYTADGTAAIAFRPDGVTATLSPSFGPAGPFLAPLLSAYYTSIVASGSNVFDPTAKRPKAVNNSYVVPAYQKVYGHNLTSDLRLGDNLSLKNIAAYRYSYVNSSSQLTGLGGLIVPAAAAIPYAAFLSAINQPIPIPGVGNVPFNSLPAAAQQAIAAQAAGVGSRFLLTENNAQALDKQWSDELQANYSSKLLTITLGGLYFHQTDASGGPLGITNTPAFALYPADGRVPLGNQSNSYNKGTSIAAYGQAEVHVTPKLDIVLGGRVTHDKKSGTYQFGGTYVPPVGVATTDPSYYTDGTFTGVTNEPFTYRGTKFTYSAGANYKPARDLLFYAKYSTGFVSGGSIAGIPWKPETVASIEGGIKADLFDRRLRANLAVFHAKYKNIQSAQGGTNIGRPEVGTAIIDLGNERAQGAELEVTVLPVRYLTLGGNLGFTDAKYTKLNPIVNTIYGTGYQPTLSPKWTSRVYAQYESDPIIGDAKLVARVDGDWRSSERFLSGSNYVDVPEFRGFLKGPARWLVNTRIGFENLGPAHLDVAFWTRNLTNNKDAVFPLAFVTYAASSDFQSARTYGLDVSVRF